MFKGRLRAMIQNPSLDVLSNLSKNVVRNIYDLKCKKTYIYVYIYRVSQNKQPLVQLV